MERLIVRRMTALVAGAFLVFALGMLMVTPAEVYAAANTATGDIAGTDADLDDSTAFNLTSATLGLTKAAFLTDGTALSDNDTLPKGTLVQFVIYVDNTTAFPVDDVSIQDVLAAEFVYQTGSMVVATQPTGTSAADIWTELENNGTSVTDAPVTPEDVASFDGTNTIDIGNQNATNDQLDIPASTAWAVRITVKMQ